MISRYRGKVGEYMWEKEMERLDRCKDRPWELQSKNQNSGVVWSMVVFAIVVFVGLLLLSLV